MARITLILTVLTTIIGLLGGFRLLMNEIRDMRERRKLTGRWIMVASFLYLLFPSMADAACTGSSPTWTSTPDLTSVSSCLSSASRGDTINVSAGSASWGSNLTITKGVNLIGAGRDSVTITLTVAGSGPAINLTPDATAISNEETIKVDGFTFDANNNTSLYGMWITGAGASGTKAFKNLIVTNNRFRNGFANTFFIRGQVRGVIAANLGDRIGIWIQPLGNDGRTEWTNGTWTSFAYETIDNLYFEDNVLTCSSSWADGNIGHITSGQGGRIVQRYNSWDFANCTAQTEVLDSHGFQNYTGTPTFPDDGQGGTMLNTAYGNTVTNHDGFRFQNIRGSWGLTFNNIITGTGSDAVIHATQYDRGCNAWHISPAWPPPDGEINNTYTFNNTYNGSSVAMTVQTPSGTPNVGAALNNSCAPVENSQFWNLDTTNCPVGGPCTAGIGRGTSAPTGNCTTGTGFWKASTVTPTVDSSVIQNATFYKCTSPNTWTAYFTPYTYPHPLRSGSSPGPGTPSPTFLFIAEWAGLVVGAAWHFRAPLIAAGMALSSITNTAMVAIPNKAAETYQASRDLTAKAILAVLPKEKQG